MPPGMAELIGAVTKLADRMDRMQERMTTPAQQGGGNEVMVAMINAQASRDAAALRSACPARCDRAPDLCVREAPHPGLLNKKAAPRRSPGRRA